MVDQQVVITRVYCAVLEVSFSSQTTFVSPFYVWIGGQCCLRLGRRESTTYLRTRNRATITSNQMKVRRINSCYVYCCWLSFHWCAQRIRGIAIMRYINLLGVK